MLQACLIPLLQSFKLAFAAEGLSFSHCHTELSYTISLIHVILSGFTTLRGASQFYLVGILFKIYFQINCSCAKILCCGTQPVLKAEL